MADGKVNPVGGSGETEGRDSACTPKWLAELVGKVDIDVASNPRAHIQAAVSLTLEGGDNGLRDEKVPRSYLQAFVDRGAVVKADTVVWCNPPYARGQVIRWVKHWRTTRFIFLLRWDPSTEWFAELIGHCTHVWFPGKRINFEPPPGVKFSSNPFPHALYLRDPNDVLIDRLSNAGYLMPIDQALLDFYLAGDESGEHERVGEPGEDGVPDEKGHDVKGGTGGVGGATGSELGALQEYGIAQWIPAAEPPPKYKKLLGYQVERVQVDDYKFTKFALADTWKKQELEWQTRTKAAGNCGDCLDCKQGFGWCVWKTDRYRKEF